MYAQKPKQATKELTLSARTCLCGGIHSVNNFVLIHYSGGASQNKMSLHKFECNNCPPCLVPGVVLLGSCAAIFQSSLIYGLNEAVQQDLQHFLEIVANNASIYLLSGLCCWFSAISIKRRNYMEINLLLSISIFHETHLPTPYSHIDWICEILWLC